MLRMGRVMLGGAAVKSAEESWTAWHIRTMRAAREALESGVGCTLDDKICGFLAGRWHRWAAIHPHGVTGRVF